MRLDNINYKENNTKWITNYEVWKSFIQRSQCFNISIRFIFIFHSQLNGMTIMSVSTDSTLIYLVCVPCLLYGHIFQFCAFQSCNLLLLFHTYPAVVSGYLSALSGKTTWRVGYSINSLPCKFSHKVLLRSSGWNLKWKQVTMKTYFISSSKCYRSGEKQRIKPHVYKTHSSTQSWPPNVGWESLLLHKNLTVFHWCTTVSL